MNHASDAADQMVRESLQFAEIAIKLSALGFKNSLSLAMAYAKENPKTRGKTSLDRLLREGKELKLISLQAKDLSTFEKLAKQYGVLFTSIKDKAASGEKIDVMFKAEDVAKLNRIYEQLGYTIPKQAQVERKKGSTRRPLENASRTCGKTASRPDIDITDPRPSIRETIRRVTEIARKLAQNAAQAAGRDVPVVETEREERGL